MTPLEQTLIHNARAHQQALADYYPKHAAGQFNDDAHADYLKHSGALNDLVSLTCSDSGLSSAAADQLRQIEFDDSAAFLLHFPSEPKSENAAPGGELSRAADHYQPDSPARVDYRQLDGVPISLVAPIPCPK